ncbi:MAG: flagellar basal body rod protein FlgB [Syntrophales bacterium]
MEALFGKTIQFLSGVLDYRAERHKVITSNVANIDTPRYVPKDIRFPDELKKAAQDGPQVILVKTNSRHLPAGPANSGLSGYGVVSSGDKVELDKEMMNVAENNLMYNLTVELLARKFRGLENVLKETK